MNILCEVAQSLQVLVTYLICRTYFEVKTAKMERKQEVLVVGMGAIGTMAAYAIQSGGQAKVTAVLRSNYEIVQEFGFTIDSIDHGKDIRGWRPSTILRSIPDCRDGSKQYDYIVVSTKNTPDVAPSLIDLIEPVIKPEVTTIVLMQNGLNIEKPFRQRFPQNTILSGVHLMGASETSSGTIVHNEPDICKIGPFDNSDTNVLQERDVHITRAKRFVEIYNACGKVNCQFDENVQFTRWHKLVYNSSYNSISAILGMDVTRMRVYEHVIDDLVKPIMEEIMAIAGAAGVRLPEDLPMKFITIDSPDSWFMPSMGQDAIKGNYLEFENIVGEPMREAQKLAVPCPTLTTVYGLLRGMQAKIKESKGLLEPRVEDANKYRG
ncbi:hypothetical protein LTR05_005038 [Lithohypha guttulata]|uniref:2-dehydropantoate 2-reductase n=1 Tax=Lithohypha guttulata TaxID=1690604 RepID=A0AAN7T0X2_9EURO|nr:hypothetical protein LTR05_005038 [Lithohypha guttulata]